MSKQVLKKVFAILLVFSTTLCSYANVYSSGEEAKIEEEFNEIVSQLKNGNYESIKNALLVKSIEDGKKITNLIPEFSNVMGLIGDVKNIIGDISGISNHNKEFTKKVFKMYDFNIINIEKVSDDTFSLSLTINMPDNNYYTELDKLIKEYNESVYGSTINGVKIVEGIGSMGVLSSNTLGISLDSVKYDYIYTNVNYLDFEKKIILRTINIINDNNNFKFDISDLVGFDLAGAENTDFHDDRSLVYKGNDIDDKNLYNYLFVPMWKIVRSEYKFK